MFIKIKLLPVRLPVFANLLTLILGLLLLVSVNYGFAQSSNPNSEVFTVVEKPPEFSGGMRAFQDYLTTNVRYPETASAANVKGKVFVSFIVRDDGRITDVGVLKGLGYGCDEEAVRVISTMPNWIPGGQSGRLLRVKYHLHVLFGIDYPKPKGH